MTCGSLWVHWGYICVHWGALWVHWRWFNNYRYIMGPLWVHWGTLWVHWGVHYESIMGTLGSIMGTLGAHYHVQCIEWVLLLCSVLQFLSVRNIRRVRAPTLFLSGLSDQLIPPAMMMELYQVCVCASLCQYVCVCIWVGSQIKLILVGDYIISYK